MPDVGQKFQEVTKKFSHVPHMTEGPARELATIMSECNARDVLELGFLSGKSTAYMAAFLEDRGGDGHITTFDLRSAVEREPNIYTVLDTLGLTHRVTPIFAHRSYTWELAKMLDQGKRKLFDFCFSTVDTLLIQLRLACFKSIY